MPSTIERRLEEVIEAAWLRQLEEIEARVWWNSQSDHLGCWIRRERLDRAGGLRHAVELLGVSGSCRACPDCAFRRPSGAAVMVLVMVIVVAAEGGRPSGTRVPIPGCSTE